MDLELSACLGGSTQIGGKKKRASRAGAVPASPSRAEGRCPAVSLSTCPPNAPRPQIPVLRAVAKRIVPHAGYPQTCFICADLARWILSPTLLDDEVGPGDQLRSRICPRGR